MKMTICFKSKAHNRLLPEIHMSQSFHSWSVDGLYQFSFQSIPVQLFGKQL